MSSRLCKLMYVVSHSPLNAEECWDGLCLGSEPSGGSAMQNNVGGILPTSVNQRPHLIYIFSYTDISNLNNYDM